MIGSERSTPGKINGTAHQMYTREMIMGEIKVEIITRMIAGGSYLDQFDLFGFFRSYK